jgi:outer membrane protein assembly factor BamB
MKILTGQPLRYALAACLLSALILCGCGGGTPGTDTGNDISGVVVDAENPDQPIGNAYVYIPAGGARQATPGVVAETMAASDGSYTLRNVPAGDWQILVEPPDASGYADFGVAVEVASSALRLRLTGLASATASRVATIEVVPEAATLDPGATRDFGTIVRDSQGNAIDAACTWTVDGAIGTIGDTGLLTAADDPATGSVIASLAGVQGTAPVTIQGKGVALSPNGWPLFKRDPLRTSLTPVNGPTTATIKWTFPVGEWVVPGPVVDTEGNLYVGASDNKLYALGPSGTARWSYETGNTIDASAALTSGGTLYVASADSTLYAMNTTGAVRWTYDLRRNPGTSSPLVDLGGHVFAGTRSQVFHAVRPDGTNLFEARFGNWITGAAAVAPDGTVYIGSWDDYLYALAPDGTVKWRYDTGDDIYSTPAIGPTGTVYVGSNDDALHAVSPAGTRVWRYAVGDDVRSSPAMTPLGNIVFGSHDGKIYSVDPQGDLNWEVTTGGRVTCAPAVDGDGRVYAGSWDGIMYCIDPSGQTLWTYQTGNRIESSAAIGDDGTLYFGSHDGSVYAIRDP